MKAEDVLQRITAALEAVRIPYMLTGSFASALYGVPRASQDIDLVIAPTASQLRELARLLPDNEYYVDLEAALGAQRRHSQFNVIDLATGWKIDLIFQKPRPFSREELGRRMPVDFQGVRLFIASAEDVVIAKLEWAKIGGSERQLEDVAGILRNRKELDRGYVERWVRDLDLEAQWQAACASAGDIATG